jgi:hypothetical protein
VSKIEQNGKTSLRRPKLLTKEVKHLMKKKKTCITENICQYGILFCPEDVSSKFDQNIGSNLPSYMTSHFKDSARYSYHC